VNDHGDLSGDEGSSDDEKDPQHVNEMDLLFDEENEPPEVVN
jgi:hypothetical protein